MQGNFTSLLLPILFFVAIYFFLFRPQQKKQKERVKMLHALKKGDKVVTIGGLHGLIVDLTEERVTLKVNDSSRLVFERSAINALATVDETEKTVDTKQEATVKE
ncbi:preprotein translocase subunit YajC [Hazenella sp. IB182357]|uniref:Preprotein translocase subunit YajC n=1 Tax=Polycladospora coralii TaxID=2771432 RepID=A0A926RTI0_9BACL|nr:preprotein translocase subunit YajC [Polycladospora coralii]MBD1371728.1 preprotein translocase subunit YajC [Polycladospora coralii]MBS7529195.1 preprotein translocase subunit YajC [Polycladospora coralii]